MTRTRCLLILAVLAAPLLAQAETSPYAANVEREIKALSSDQIAALRAGRGMGYATPAELNGYPGPRHVLDLSEELKLSDAQQQASERVFEEMKRAAVPLGEQLIEAHRALESAFQDRRASADGIAALSARIGDIEGRLRAVHLSAHVAERALLEPGQIARYAELRGYGSHAH